MKLLLITCLLGSISCLKAASPAYNLDLEHGDLRNSGSLGGEAENIPSANLSVAPGEGPTKTTPALVFELTSDGQHGPWLQLPDSEHALELLQPGDGLTISAWILWQGPNQHPGDRQIIVNAMGDGNKSGWAFSILKSGQLQFAWTTVQGGSQRVSAESVPAGQWTHIAVTWSNETKTNNLKFFLNGNEVPSDVVFTGGGPIVSRQGATITVGAISPGNLPLNGSLAMFRIYQEALPAPEIESLTALK